MIKTYWIDLNSGLEVQVDRDKNDLDRIPTAEECNNLIDTTKAQWSRVVMRNANGKEVFLDMEKVNEIKKNIEPDEFTPNLTHVKEKVENILIKEITKFKNTDVKYIRIKKIWNLIKKAIKWYLSHVPRLDHKI